MKTTETHINAAWGCIAQLRSRDPRILLPDDIDVLEEALTEMEVVAIERDKLMEILRNKSADVVRTDPKIGKTYVSRQAVAWQDYPGKRITPVPGRHVLVVCRDRTDEGVGMLYLPPDCTYENNCATFDRLGVLWWSYVPSPPLLHPESYQDGQVTIDEFNTSGRRENCRHYYLGDAEDRIRLDHLFANYCTKHNHGNTNCYELQAEFAGKSFRAAIDNDIFWEKA